MDEIAIRRLFLSDDEWERTSSSWKKLKPRKDYNQYQPDDETVDEYVQRINQAGYHIPYLVADQWIYPLYYNHNTVNNYGWIDYGNVVFLEQTLPVETLAAVSVIEEYQPYVDTRSKNTPFDGFSCRLQDLQHWKTQATWRVPPIVIDVASFPAPPPYAELSGPLQLVEGHSRMGYLRAMERAGLLHVREHTVFLMRYEC